MQFGERGEMVQEALPGRTGLEQDGETEMRKSARKRSRKHCQVYKTGSEVQNKTKVDEEGCKEEEL
jgi:hypothetical protein